MTQLIDPYGLAHDRSGQVLRQSTLGSFDVCHRRVMYDRDPNIPYGTGPNRAFGTAYHACLEGLYLHENYRECLQRGKEAFNGELEAIPAEDWPDSDWPTGPKAAWENVVTLVDTYISLRPIDMDHREILAVEGEFFAPASHVREGWVVKGAVDLALSHRHGTLEIHDHKTARRPWKRGKEGIRNTNQAAWYSYWFPRVWHAAGGEWFDLDQVQFIFDVMTLNGSFDQRIVTVRPGDIAAVLLKAQSACELIDNDGPWLPNTQSFLCSSKYCDHWSVCPFGEALDRGTVDAPLITL